MREAKPLCYGKSCPKLVSKSYGSMGGGGGGGSVEDGLMDLGTRRRDVLSFILGGLGCVFAACACFSIFFLFFSCFCFSSSCFFSACACSLLSTSSSVNITANFVEITGDRRLEGGAGGGGDWRG